jgi:site-specific recombinase XerD
MRLTELHEEFVTYLEVERDYSAYTAVAYRSDFQTFLRFLKGVGLLLRVDRVDRSVVRRYVAWLKGRGLKASTVARHINSLRSFWNYLRESQYTETDPFFRLSLPKRPEEVPPHLSAEEAEALLSAAQRQSCIFNAFRDVAVLSVLLYTGMRRGELLNLRLCDVDLTGRTLRVVAGKGRKSRVLPLVPEACGALSDWLELRPTHCRHDRVFTCKWGAPLSKRGLASCLRRALDAAGVGRPGITLHSLRHTFACLLLKGGCDLYSLQRMLGHSRLDTTAGYLHATVEDLRQAVSAHPLCNGGGEARSLTQSEATRPGSVDGSLVMRYLGGDECARQSKQRAADPDR